MFSRHFSIRPPQKRKSLTVQGEFGKIIDVVWRKLCSVTVYMGNVRYYQFVIRGIGDLNLVNIYGSNITERKQAEEEKMRLETQLRQAQKIEAIGTLAGGIAHDFNNILAALIGYADLAKDDIPEGTIAHQNQKEVINAANRATELVKQILTFGRKDEANLIPVQINTIVQEALKLLRSSLPTTIEIHQDINCNSSIMGDETHIHLNISLWY